MGGPISIEVNPKEASPTSSRATWIISAVASAMVLGSLDTAGQVFAPQTSAFDTAVISVTGTGEAFVHPTRAIVLLQIVTQEDSPEAAALRNGEIRTRVTDALLGLGYAENEVGLWAYGAGPSSARAYGGPPMAAAASYEAKSGVRVVVEPVERLDAVVSTLLLSGASVSTVFLASDGSSAARRDAAQQAVRQARIEAEAMAEAAGGRLGDLVSVTTMPDYASIATASMRWSVYPGGPAADGIRLTPSDLTVSVTVQATWVFVARR